MSLLRNILFKRALIKELSQQEVEEEHTASSNDSNLTNESLQIAKIERQLQNWGLPIIDLKEIFTHSTFNFKKNLCVKIVERKFSVYGSIDSIQFFPKEDILKHKKDFEFLHIGAMQVALKLMFRSGLDTPVLAILRDKSTRIFQILS